MNTALTVTYPLIMASAVVVGALVASRTQRSLDLGPVEKFGVGLGAFCGAMIGAKLPFVITDWQGLLNGSAWFSDGKTILFGLVGGYFGVELAKWLLDIRVKTGDSFAVPVPLAVAIGRLACFHVGCCYGTPTSAPWGVVFNNVDALPRHPTQLYESTFHFVAAALLFVMQSRGVFRGQLIKLYILAYLLFRFGTEAIRPEAALWGGLTAYQWAAAVLVLLFGYLWLRDRQPGRL